MRGNRFADDGGVQWYHSTGSGLDIADIQPAVDRYFFGRCSIRHAAFSRSGDATAALHVEAEESNVAQWWFSVGLEGRADFRSCDIAQLWVEPSADQFVVTVDGGQATGLQGVTADGGVQPLDAFASGTGVPVSGFMDYRR